MEKQTAYIPVDVKEKTPEPLNDNSEISVTVIAMDKYGNMVFGWYNYPYKNWENDSYEELNNITHWLEKKENALIFTPQELLERDKERDKLIAGDAFDAGESYGENSVYYNKMESDKKPEPDKEQYLNNLIK